MIRVLVVDDSVVVRGIVTKMLAAADGMEVVGSAVDGQAALEKVERLRPDVITMDVEMPRMDGITAVRELRAAGHRMPVIMLSTLTERGATATIDALTAGASDYVAKPSGTAGLSEAVEQLAEQLLPRIRALAGPGTRAAAAPEVRPPAKAGAPAGPALGRGRAAMVLIGSSTGGPAALSTLLSSLTAPPAVPVLVTQHMPAVFTRQLADRLNRVGAAQVVEAHDGQALQAGTVYIAPGGQHLEVAGVRGAWRAHLSDGPPVNYCRPSVEVMARSAAARVGAAHLLMVMLTGMGSDGASAFADIARGGGTFPFSRYWFTIGH